MSITPDPPLIRMEGLEKWYGAFQALANINLTVRRGEKIVLCGPSGPGKSTLVGFAADGMTMIRVTLEMGFARRVADRVSFMAKGERIEEAPPETFFRAPQHRRTRDFPGQILAGL
jgi:ABC-type polar amino acid transport system ATPase subunit